MNCLGTLGLWLMKINRPIARVNFWTLHFIPFIYMSIFMPIPQCLDCSRFVENFKIRDSVSFSFDLILKTVLAIVSPMNFHMNFRTTLSISTKKSM